MALQNVMDGKPRAMQADRLIARFRQLREGEIIGHAEIETIINERRGVGSGYGTVVSKARHLHCKENGINLQCVRNTGYMHPSGIEQIKAAVRGTRAHVRGIRRKTEHIAVVSDDRLHSDTERDIQRMTLQNSRLLVEFAKGQTKASIALVGKPEVGPQLKLPG